MKNYLIGFEEPDKPSLIFYDIRNFIEESIGNFTAISFEEDGISYLYTNRYKNDEYVEFDEKAPKFATYLYLNEKQAEPFIKAFGGYTTNAEAQAAKKK